MAPKKRKACDDAEDKPATRGRAKAWLSTEDVAAFGAYIEARRDNGEVTIATLEAAACKAYPAWLEEVVKVYPWSTPAAAAKNTVEHTFEWSKENRPAAQSVYRRVTDAIIRPVRNIYQAAFLRELKDGKFPSGTQKEDAIARVKARIIRWEEKVKEDAKLARQKKKMKAQGMVTDPVDLEESKEGDVSTANEVTEENDADNQAAAGDYVLPAEEDDEPETLTSEEHQQTTSAAVPRPCADAGVVAEPLRVGGLLCEAHSPLEGTLEVAPTVDATMPNSAGKGGQQESAEQTAEKGIDNQVSKILGRKVSARAWSKSVEPQFWKVWFYFGPMGLKYEEISIDLASSKERVHQKARAGKEADSSIPKSRAQQREKKDWERTHAPNQHSLGSSSKLTAGEASPSSKKVSALVTSSERHTRQTSWSNALTAWNAQVTRLKLLLESNPAKWGQQFEDFLEQNPPPEAPESPGAPGQLQGEQSSAPPRQ
ncbi:hypothetical protein AB1Y20_018748 [Prymnesium parvum]|uniref:Uncharacterized protein n=1 Tax=Prymnesium parvum TaxID=97485 RepID=A0AB34JS50_PRYPA